MTVAILLVVVQVWFGVRNALRKRGGGGGGLLDLPLNPPTPPAATE